MTAPPATATGVPKRTTTIPIGSEPSGINPQVNFLQGNARPSILASDRPGNRADYTVGSGHDSDSQRDRLS
jgi:hypothetical protein